MICGALAKFGGAACQGRFLALIPSGSGRRGIYGVDAGLGEIGGGARFHFTGAAYFLPTDEDGEGQSAGYPYYEEPFAEGAGADGHGLIFPVQIGLQKNSGGFGIYTALPFLLPGATLQAHFACGFGALALIFHY